MPAVTVQTSEKQHSPHAAADPPFNVDSREERATAPVPDIEAVILFYLVASEPQAVSIRSLTLTCLDHTNDQHSTRVTLTTEGGIALN